METFWGWLSRLRLDENYFTFSPRQYDRLFDDELERLIARTHDSAHLDALETMRTFNWTAYIAASVRNAGIHDYRARQEAVHDIVTKLLIGRLFRGFDELRSGPFDLRFKRSVANAIRNMVEKEKTRKRLIPTVPFGQESVPNRPSTPDDDERLVNRFRELVRKRLGGLGVAVLQVRLDGGEVKSLVGCKALGSPGKWVIKRIVQQVKELARDYARTLGDSELLRRIEQAMAAESETVGKRQAALRARAAAGAT